MGYSLCTCVSVWGTSKSSKCWFMTSNSRPLICMAAEGFLFCFALCLHAYDVLIFGPDRWLSKSCRVVILFTFRVVTLEKW